MPTPQQSSSQGTSSFGDVLVSARSLAEYRAMFDLTDDDLAGSVLDCPGGAASFTAEARRQGLDVTAVDPTYPPPGPATKRGQALRRLGEHATGETLSNYIAGHKLRVARDLLTNTDMDINGIGEILGYTHPSSFIRMFHRVEGITPAQYREEHNAAENG